MRSICGTLRCTCAATQPRALVLAVAAAVAFAVAVAVAVLVLAIGSFILQATSALEAAEWMQLLKNPELLPVKPKSAGVPFASVGAVDVSQRGSRGGK